MSRSFDGVSDRIDFANVFDINASGNDAAFSAWLFPDDLVSGGEYFIVAGRAGDAAAGLLFYHEGGENNSVGMFRARATSDSTQWRFGTDELVSGSWQHVYLESVGGGGGAGMEAYVDDTIPGSEATEAGSGLFTASSGQWSVGGRIWSDTRMYDGLMGEVGVWDRRASPDERAALAAGWSPLCFRRGLRFYNKLHTPSIDVVSGGTPTLDGTAVARHPRIFYPR